MASRHQPFTLGTAHRPDQARYRDLPNTALLPNALIVIGTFASDGAEVLLGTPTAR